MLDEDQRVAGLFKNGHELKDCEGSTDLQLLNGRKQKFKGRRRLSRKLLFGLYDMNLQGFG